MINNACPSSHQRRLDKKAHCKEKIDDRLKRINLKSKRMRNLIKKSIELS